MSKEKTPTKQERKYPYTALWLSPSSLADLDKCQRLYYLRNAYKNPSTSRRIQVASPYLSLGTAVHQTIDSISGLPKNERFKLPLTRKYEQIWENYSGKVGGFLSDKQEADFKARGHAMIEKLEIHPGPLTNFALKIRETVPSFWLSEKEQIILCGSIDWIELLPDNTIHIIDFKTGKKEEDAGSLQLPIYLLIVGEKLSRSVSKLSYWYLERSSQPKEIPFPKMDGVTEGLIEKGKQAKSLKAMNSVECLTGGCRYCQEYDQVARGKAKFVGVDQVMNKDVFLV